MDKEKVQAEINAKKARLAALKEKREARKRAGGGGGGNAKAAREERKKQRAAEREARMAAKSKPATDVLADVTSLVGDTTAAPRRGAAPTLMVSTPQNCKINIDSVIPETYTKNVKCQIIGSSDEEKKIMEAQRDLEARKIKMQEEEEKMKIFKEQIKKDKLKYDKVQEETKIDDIQELTNIQVRRIETSKDFQGFFSSASKIVERALNFSYDLTVDYGAAEHDDGATEDEKLIRRCKLHDVKKTGARAITSIAWSADSPGTLLSSYDGQDDPMSLEPDGTVLIWNMKKPNKPEYYFYCNSAVLTAEFHHSHPKLILGGCRSGQVVVWDMRAKRSPVDRTSLSRGHTYPVYALRCLPAVNNNNLISISTDGLLCQWNDSNLHTPANEIDLNATLKEKESKESSTTDEITTTSLDYAADEVSSVILGSDEGNVYKARTDDKNGIYHTLDAHDAPVTNVQYHPTLETSPRKVADLFLTSSYDWTVKLWSDKANRSLFTFESARDYVFDCQWSPVHPAIFATGDGTGKLDLWNLNQSTEVPHYSVQVEKEKGAIAKLKWNSEGSNLACGMSTGVVHVFDGKEELYTPSNEDSDIFYSRMDSESNKE